MAPRDQIQQLEQEVSDRIAQALGALRERLSGVLREGHEVTQKLLTELEPELPESLLGEATVDALQGDAAAAGQQAGFSRLLDTMAALDQASSQAKILTALLEGTSGLADRAAFFLFRGEQVQGWGARLGGDEVGALPSAGWTASGAWLAVASGAGPTPLTEEERDDVATRLEGPVAREASLIPFVLRDAVAGALYVDGVTSGIEAIQILTFVAAQGVEVLPLRKRTRTSTLLGVGEVPVSEEPMAEEPAILEPEEATLEEPEQIATEEVVEDAVEEVEEPEAVALPVEIEEPATEPETSFEPDTAFEAEREAEPEPAIEDAAGGDWTLEEAPPAETAPLVVTQAESLLEEVAPPEELDAPVPQEEATWTEPVPEPPLDVEASPELEATESEAAPIEPPPAPMPVGEETVLIRTPLPADLEPMEAPVKEIPTSTEVAPPPDFEPPSTEVTPPADMELVAPPEMGAPSTEVTPPPDMEPASTEVVPPSDLETYPSTQAEPPPEPEVGTVSESPLVTPPEDLEGPGRAFSTTRVPIDAEQVQAHEEARRLARLLVSEIKLYNEEEVDEGRRTGDVYQRLKDDIDRSRQMYEERIDPEVRDSTDYFYQELVRILGGGDADALGM